ncbi:unnamed protein product [Dicrocoelium dendriticum]|nr:unnamed protein product [Dicrocoelium dendriticum]
MRSFKMCQFLSFYRLRFGNFAAVITKRPIPYWKISWCHDHDSKADYQTVAAHLALLNLPLDRNAWEHPLRVYMRRFSATGGFSTSDYYNVFNCCFP